MDSEFFHGFLRRTNIETPLASIHLRPLPIPILVQVTIVDE
jgi:hypothetical protein